MKIGDTQHIRRVKSSNLKPDPPISECMRCGICCKKGGPSFHHEDKMLIERGIVLLKYLYTIRKGEPAHDNVKGVFFPATSDIIKIKGRGNTWTCVLFDEKEQACTIYKNRPLECRVLTCWDTRKIEKIYSKSRLTRKDLTAEIEGLWDLIEDHQKRCSYYTIKNFVETLNGDKKCNALEDILGMIKYDFHLRALVAEKGNTDPEIMEFLFGRPLMDTIRMFGLKVERICDDYHLRPL